MPGMSSLPRNPSQHFRQEGITVKSNTKGKYNNNLYSLLSDGEDCISAPSHAPRIPPQVQTMPHRQSAQRAHIVGHTCPPPMCSLYHLVLFPSFCHFRIMHEDFSLPRREMNPAGPKSPLPVGTALTAALSLLVEETESRVCVSNADSRKKGLFFISPGPYVLFRVRCIVRATQF
jgi:hypothetical protein